MAPTFGEWMREVREAQEWTIQSCAARADMKWEAWARLEKDEPRRRNGGMPQRSRDTAKAVAKGLKVAEEEALKRAGYTPEDNESGSRPSNPKSESNEHSHEPMSDAEKQQILRLFEGKSRATREVVVNSVAALLGQAPDIPIKDTLAMDEAHEEPQEGLEAVTEENADNLLLQEIFLGLKINAYTGEMSGPAGKIPPTDTEELSRLMLQFHTECLRKKRDDTAIADVLHKIRDNLNMAELANTPASQIGGRSHT